MRLGVTDMPMPMPNSVMCMYLRRKDGSLGDDLNADFEPPVYFRGRKETVTKSVAGIGGLYSTNSLTYCLTYDLTLKMDEMKGDDVIVFCGDNNVKGAIKSGDRPWHVSSVECQFDNIRVQSNNAEENERKAPKRILIQ
jgi:hypothetical protein